MPWSRSDISSMIVILKANLEDIEKRTSTMKPSKQYAVYQHLYAMFDLEVAILNTIESE